MIPRQIFALWLQGELAAPALVKMCLLRWRRLNPTYDVRVLDMTDVEEILGSSSLDIRAMEPQAISDVLRLKLLTDQGGVWIDATTFPTVPLETWLPAVSGSGFFAFRGHAAPLDIDSWFLAAAPDHIISRRWLEAAEAYWSRPRNYISFSTEMFWGVNYNLDPLSFFRSDLEHNADTYPYFWVMYLFTKLLSADAEFSSAWHLVPERSSVECHAVQKLPSAGPEASDEELITASQGAPVQKLAFKDPRARQWLRLDELSRDLDERFPLDDTYWVHVPEDRPEALRSRMRASIPWREVHALIPWRARALGGQFLRRVGRSS